MTGQGRVTVVLNVAEKPSVARALAGVFSRMPGARDGGPVRGQAAQMFNCDNVVFPDVTIQGNGAVQGAARNRPHRMITTSVRGHLASQDFGPAYGWSSVTPIALFDAPIEISYRDDMQPLKQMLGDQARNADAIILWLDCDREGEAICDEVRTACLAGNPGLERRNRIYRAKFSTVMPQEIERALKSLGRVNENFVQAVQARSEHDLRVGAAFTRFQTLRLQKTFDEFANGSQGVVSYGPCQFPTLGFVVERWARIETFIPEDFWYIDMSVKVNANGEIVSATTAVNSNNQNRQETQRGSGNMGKPISLKWKRGRLYDRVLTMSLYESCLDANEATVVSMTGRPKNKWRPIPLATVELQKRASKYLRIGSDNLMTAAEELYHQGLISYPRTETEKFRPEFEHIPLIQSFQAIDGIFGEYSSKLLSNNNFQNPRAGPNDDSAHPPITPCKAVDPQSIQDNNQRSVYTLVVKHYLACCSRDAIGKETVLTLKMASEEFTARGLMVLERNWLEIYTPFERWYTGHGELPNVQVGSRIRPSSLLMKESKTTAPQPISEVELISLMDKNKIGTDATIAQHITTIQDRAYAEKNGQQQFNPTKLGIALVEGYNSMGYQLNRPDLRREMEAECNAVAAGQKRKEEIMQPILAKMIDVFRKANAEAVKLDEAVARHFTRIGTNDANSTLLQQRFSACGTCEGMLSLKELRADQNQRRGGNNNFQRAKILHCASCSIGLRLPRGTPSAITNEQDGNSPTKCPICNFQAVKISQGDGYNGNGYKFCPNCFTNAPAQYGGTGGDFRCFNCTHPTCSLASGTSSEEIFPCPFCSAGGNAGKVTMRKTARGHILSCTNNTATGPSCDFIIWLPKEAKSISIVGATNGNSPLCGRCSSNNKDVKKLKFTWKSGSVPPGTRREHIGCVLCDETLKADFGVSVPRLNQVRGRQMGRGSGRGYRSRSTGRGEGGGGGRGQWQSTRRPIERNLNNQGRGRGGSATAGGAGGFQNTNNNGNVPTCFRCQQPGHFANNCPNNR